MPSRRAIKASDRSALSRVTRINDIVVVCRLQYGSIAWTTNTSVHAEYNLAVVSISQTSNESPRTKPASYHATSHLSNHAARHILHHLASPGTSEPVTPFTVCLQFSTLGSCYAMLETRSTRQTSYRPVKPPCRTRRLPAELRHPVIQFCGDGTCRRRHKHVRTWFQYCRRPAIARTLGHEAKMRMRLRMCLRTVVGNGIGISGRRQTRPTPR